MLQIEKTQTENMMRFDGQPLSLPPLTQSEQAILPPVVICPTEVDNINITLEKNQQCACKDCGKLFNSVWYLKQHAVKHSNDRPFRCKYCLKTYKFRSNLYQHKCPDRIKNGNTKRLMSRGITLNQTQIHDDTETASESTKNCLPEYHSSQQQHQCHNQTYATNVSLVKMLSDYGDYQNMQKSDTINNEEKVSEHAETEIEPSSVTTRKKPLEQAVIDDYIQRNKHKLHPCRKCRIQFPSREYLSRHTVYHTENETLIHRCRFCPQKYATEKALNIHLEVHSAESNFICKRCNAPFRSMLALRRHKDRCRECLSPPFGASVDYMSVPASSTFDEYAFIDAEEAVTHLHLSVLDEDVIAAKGPDSGLGSEGSNHSYTTSPARSSVHLEDDEGFEVEAKRNLGILPKLRVTIPPKIPQEKKKKENEEEPGFRSRFSSITQSRSSSGVSNNSSDGPSPTRRMSVVEIHDKALNSYSHYNSFMGTNHGQISSGTHSYATESSAGQSMSYSNMRVSSFSTTDRVAPSTGVLLLRATSFTPTAVKAKSENVILMEFLNATLQRVCDENTVSTNFCALKWLLYRRAAVNWMSFVSLALFSHLFAFLLSELHDGLICARVFFSKNCAIIGKETSLKVSSERSSSICGFCKAEQQNHSK